MNDNPYKKNIYENEEIKQCKLLGGLVGFFFSIIGLFAGFLYPTQSKERNAFIRGWVIGFLILFLVIGIGLLIYGIIVLNTPTKP